MDIGSHEHTDVLKTQEGVRSPGEAVCREKKRGEGGNEPCVGQGLQQRQ